MVEQHSSKMPILVQVQKNPFLIKRIIIKSQVAYIIKQYQGFYNQYCSNFRKNLILVQTERYPVVLRHANRCDFQIIGCTGEYK